MYGLEFLAKKEGKELITPGVSWGAKNLEILAENPPFMVVKAAGHTGWSGQGMVGYYETGYYILKVISSPNERGYSMTKEIERKEFGRQWRQGRADLIAKMNELAEQEREKK